LGFEGQILSSERNTAMAKKKRGNGEGSIYERKDKDGRVIGYRGAYFARTLDGARKRFYVSGKTKTEVKAKLRKVTADRDDGIVFDTQNLTVGRYLERWLPDSVKDTVKQTTFECYERLMRLHLQPTTLGSVKLKALTPANVRALYREKLDSGLSPASVQRVHALLHKALKQAVNDGLVPRNVTEAVKAPRQSRKEIQALNPEQARAFLGAARGERLETLYLLAVHTGLRQSELFGLMWQDVDLEANRLSVRRILSAAKNGPIFTTPKNDKSRSVRLTPRAVESLHAHRKRQAEEREKLGKPWRDHGLVFCTQVGTPLNRNNVHTRSFKPLVERASLPPTLRFHDLRHTFATLMLKGGEHPKVVQEMMGHSNINITLDTYSHVLPDMQDKAADRLGVLLS
jgi:integrase